MRQSFLLDIIIYFFIVLFVYTGTAKFVEIHSMKDQLDYSSLFGSMASFVAWVLPIAEILLAVGLLISKLRLRAMYITFVLMTLFTCYVIINLLIDRHLACSCGGILEDLTPEQHIIFNGACVILSALAILVHRRRQLSIRFKWLTGTSAAGLFLVIGWALFTAFIAPTKGKMGMEGRLLPSFDLLFPDSVTHFNTTDIKKGRPFIMIGFSPYCHYCQEEIRDIITHIGQFKETRIYLVTPFSYPSMKQFYIWFKLGQYPNITTGIDYKNTFLTYFRAKQIPFIAIFDDDKRLEKAIIGRANISDLRGS